MGKARKDRKRGPRHDPVGLNGSECVEEELNGSKASVNKGEALIQTVVDQLQSSNVDDKLCGLHMLSEVFDGRTLEEVVRNRVVRMAAPLLVDPNSTVRNSTAGAIRNLTTNGGPDFCDILIEQDVMTPLCSLIQKFGNEWQPKVEGTSSGDEEADTFIQAVNILWNLCESSATALKYFNQAHLLPLLVRCLDINTFGTDVAITVAECLQTVTEENKEAISEMQGLSEQLQQLLSSPNEEINMILLKVLIAGVLINIHSDGIGAMDPSRLSLIMASLSTALAYDQRRMLNQLTSELDLNIQKLNPRNRRRKQEDVEEEDEEMDSENEKESVEESKPTKKLKTRGKSTHTQERTEGILQQEKDSISNAARILQAQQIALEILANLCSGDDEEGEMDLDDSDVEEMSDSSFGEEGGSKEALPASVPSDVLEAVVSQRLITKVWDKTQLPAENVCDILCEDPDTQILFNRLGLLRSRAFLCLQNLLAVMDLEELGGSNDLYNMWLETTKLVFEKTKADDLQLLEAATSVMRAAVLRLAEAKATQFSTLTENDLKMLLQCESQCEHANVRANLIRIVSSIGQMLTPSLSPHLTVIGKFLMDAAVRDAELWVTAEALDCIFDVFGEDETDKAAFDIDLVNRLRGLAPALKNKVRLQKKNLGDHYHLVMTASNNLNRFIKYKSNRLASFKAIGHS
ncbi:HEAT repeat-containing protein 3 [Thrips palmi]|uniref:HEAT repeat-containing protein 3 n=1 Tax=Thrips palmi TaxID=161013 RepID=A0A6P8Y9Z4_THRPL|nr:HEAT repeat-containing protein 3 [Thrips palmi]